MDTGVISLDLKTAFPDDPNAATNQFSVSEPNAHLLRLRTDLYQSFHSLARDYLSQTSDLRAKIYFDQLISLISPHRPHPSRFFELVAQTVIQEMESLEIISHDISDSWLKALRDISFYNFSVRILSFQPSQFRSLSQLKNHLSAYEHASLISPKHAVELHHLIGGKQQHLYTTLKHQVIDNFRPCLLEEKIRNQHSLSNISTNQHEDLIRLIHTLSGYYSDPKSRLAGLYRRLNQLFETILPLSSQLPVSRIDTPMLEDDLNHLADTKYGDLRLDITLNKHSFSRSHLLAHNALSLYQQYDLISLQSARQLRRLYQLIYLEHLQLVFAALSTDSPSEHYLISEAESYHLIEPEDSALLKQSPLSRLSRR